MAYLPEEVIERIFDYLTSRHDRNSLSLVSKSWYKVDRYSRYSVYINNCYALSPERLIWRFPKLRSLTLKGRRGLTDFKIFSSDCGCNLDLWIVALAKHCPWLEELRLKRMVVSDEWLVIISNSFPNFKSLVLNCCDGFTTIGLVAIASNCTLLEQLDLENSMVRDERGQWLSCFPEKCTSLAFLDFKCLEGAVNTTDLVRLVAGCPNLKTLRLNKTVPINKLPKILTKAPQLVELGFGSYNQVVSAETERELSKAIHKCRSIQSLSVFSRLPSSCLRAFYPICWNLIFLNLRLAIAIQSYELIKLIKLCPKLQRLWILDCIGDKGLEEVASTCKDLEELRVFQAHIQVEANSGVTEEGLVAISTGCPNLHSLRYFCHRMTNAALITLAKNCPNIICFKLCISNPKTPDHATVQPLDDGFGAIVHACKGITKLSVSGFLTDQVFLYIGMYAERLEVLSISNAGESNAGMLYVFNGCRNIRKLEIRNCHFGDTDTALFADIFKDESIRASWMSSCYVSLEGCLYLYRKCFL